MIWNDDRLLLQGDDAMGLYCVLDAKFRRFRASASMVEQRLAEQEANDFW